MCFGGFPDKNAGFPYLFAAEDYTVMRFSDKELAYFALSLTPDREGLLEKKGAGRAHGECLGDDRAPVCAFIATHL